MAQSQQQAIAQLSRAEQARLNLPEGLKTLGPFPFGSLNQKDSRFAIADNEFWWLENWIKVGNGLLRPVGDVGPSLYNATAQGKVILSFFWYIINLVEYVVVFHTDGTAVQVRKSNGALTWLSTTPGTFWMAGALQPPACAQWGAQYLLIANNFDQNNYWAWDGQLLYTAGSISPIINLTSGGSNYEGVPTVSVYGGFGGSVSLTPVVSGGSVVALEITNPGSFYEPGDIPQVAFSGGGSDASAIVTAILFPSSLEAIVVEAEGSGYGGGTAVVISPALGGAAATPTIVGGRITGITVTNPGSGYTTAPGITFTGGGGSGALAVATLDSQGVQALDVIESGTNYVGIPTLTIMGGGGINATATAVMSGPGPIESLDVTYSGSGYTFVPTVTISDPTGTGASISPQLTNGIVTGFTVVAGGSGYTSPSVTIQAPGGSGTTATATAAIGNGGIVSAIMVNNGGGYTTAPAVIVQPTNNAAAATLNLMPFGVSGSAIENYQSRVFLIAPFSNNPTVTNAGTFLISAPESLSDFSTADGGIIQVVTDASLRATFVNLKQSTGNLYFLGDSSTSVLSNINTSASSSTAASVTTYTYQNMDPQVGAAWRDSFQPFSRTILFGNSLGVWGLYGGADTKVSEKIDNLFANSLSLPGAVTPSSAVASLFAQRLYLLNKTIIDPRTETKRTLLLGWNEHEWFVFSQSANLTYIATEEINTTMTAWGTDGANLFPLFASPSRTLTKSWSSKLYGIQTNYIAKQARAWFMNASDRAGAGIPFSIDVDTEIGSQAVTGSPLLITNPYPQSALALGPSGDIYASMLGLSFSTSCADMELYTLMLGYTDYSAVVGDM